ncbi:MAG TPA: TonB family protein [Nitrospira sp.]|nr:TonB family protein [Nitrospira sp.]
MENVLVAQSWQPKRSMTGWGASLLLHACLALAAFGLMPKMAMVVEKEPFKWDVALVEAPREVVRQEEPAPMPQVQPPVPTPVKPRPEPVRAVPPPPQPVQRQVETRVVPQAIQREVQPVVETVRPQEQIQPTREVVQVQAKPIEPQEIQKTEPLMQAAVPAEVVRETAPAVEQTVVEAAPATAQTYQAQTVVSEPTVMETRPEPVVTASAPVVHAAPAAEPAPASPAPAVEAVASVSEPVPAPPAPVAAVPAPVAAAQPDPATLQEHQVVARVATPRPATKADYGWLAESLHRRIIELRHYPSTARLNGWEGKVVLKVSIRQDGQLKDVEVVKSSGHESLDQAAMEAVRRACPLHMKHELTAPMVVLHLPVSYSLNR